MKIGDRVWLSLYLFGMATLALLGHWYFLRKPQFKIDALLFYSIALLLLIRTGRRLAPADPRWRHRLGGWLGLNILAGLWAIIFGQRTPMPARGWLTFLPPLVGLALLGQGFWQLMTLDVIFATAPRRQREKALQPARGRWQDRHHLALMWLIAALLIGLFAQGILNRRANPWGGVGLYLLSTALVGLAVRMDAELFPRASQADNADGAMEIVPKETEVRPLFSRRARAALLATASLMALVNYQLSANNRFHLEGVIAWVVSVVTWGLAFWAGRPRWLRRPSEGLAALRPYRKGILVRWWLLMLLALLLLGGFFRFYQLADLPGEMNSDHAEKLLDVQDVLNGKYAIFFPRNTGREAWQFYWTAMLIKYFHLPMDFNTLKLGAGLVGVCMLPALYLLVKEVFDREVAWWALLFGAVTSWSVLPVRLGLRYAFLQMPLAWTLFFWARGIRRSRRNDFLVMGFFLGLGLYGYQPFRAMLIAVPVAFVAWWVLAMRWRQPGGYRLWVDFLCGIGLTVLVAVPIIRYSVDFPKQMWFRILSRVSGIESPLPGSPLKIFANNMLRALGGFHWIHDNVWVANVSKGPIIDPILGALLVCGTALALWWAWRVRDPLPLALTLVGVLMLGPSAAALAFPSENPSLIRMEGAIPTVVALCALGPGLFVRRVREVLSGRWRWLSLSTAAVLAVSVVWVNQQRIFVDYARHYCLSAQNASDIARAIEAFAESGGSLENAYHVPWPHWVDTRAINIWWGNLSWWQTHALMNKDALREHLEQPGPKFYVLHKDNVKSDSGSSRVSLEDLQRIYPDGWAQLKPSSRCPGHEFWVFYVPPP